MTNKRTDNDGDSGLRQAQARMTTWWGCARMTECVGREWLGIASRGICAASKTIDLETQERAGHRDDDEE